MTYHANHSTCNNSCWENKVFHSEVMVYFGENLTRNDILENNHEKNIFEITNKINPDFINLTKERTFFNQFNFDKDLKIKIKMLSEKLEREPNQEEIENLKNDLKKRNYEDTTYDLNQDVINWLNENIKDVKNIDGTEIKEINERKGWCIGNEDFIARTNEMKIFFKRELDALKFIREFSIFKEPIFYFDYFSEDRRNMDLNKYIYLYNEYATNNNLELIDVSKISLDNLYQGNINLDTLSFILLDWEKTEIDEETGEIYKADDIELTEEELEEYVKSLYKTTNEDISYEKHNLTNFPEYIKDLTKTDEISLYYDIEENQNEIDI